MYFTNNKHFILVCLLVCVSCNKSPTAPTQNEEISVYLNLYMDNYLDDGLYSFNYPNQSSNSYTKVYYETLPQYRIEWSSKDSFEVYHMGTIIKEPIINYATYSNNEGDGRQLIYLNQSHLYDTLSIVGCIGDLCNEIKFYCY